jgi:hypothetical protein
VSVTDPAGPRIVSTMECLRVYAAAGTGICLRPQTAWAYEVVVLDARLRPGRVFAVPGLPNRARVSPSGRFVAWTVFVGGDSYTSSGFSTRTGILDTRTGAAVDTLEEFTVVRDGRPYRNVDVNFWGVTFAADDNRFHATMSTASVDDQAAWLDGATLAYTLRQDDGRPDVWTVPADGTGASRLLMPGAESPSPLGA